MQTTTGTLVDMADEHTRPLTISSVLAGETWTDYFRIGCGVPVVLLTEEEGVPSGPLFHSLAGGFRLIVPMIPELLKPDGLDRGNRAGATEGFSAWLKGFLDGLGLVRASIVADAPLALSTLRFALHDPERVGRLVMLLPERAAGDAPASAVQHRVRSHQPLLLVSGDSTVATESDDPPLVGEITRFLRGLHTSGDTA